MRFFGLLNPSQILSALLAVLLISAPAFAQDNNAYRAEIVLLERKTANDSIEEQMASRHPPVADAEMQLWVVGQDGQRRSDLKLVPRSQLSLNNAAQRLEQSGRYRVLASAGWYESFPPDYQGEPMRIEVGDWLEEAGHREIEGTIQIERVRFLHVSAELNHWQPDPEDLTQAQPGQQANGNQAADNASPDTAPANAPDTTGLGSIPRVGGVLENDAVAANIMPKETRKELVTWIRETRRMRSEEIHFMDSPTLGVLILFKKIENDESSSAPVN
ncbi:MAG: CsiV family protein [Marinobacter sp.]|uniref:CsiV family protein n=1 Tax=Marinobacter sp. TaxID=50741 RepID=UPI0034A08103